MELAELQERASEMSGLLANPDEAWWMSPRRTDSLHFLDVALQKLAIAVDGADAAPTPDARESFAKLKPTVDAVLRAWNEFRATSLATQ